MRAVDEKQLKWPKRVDPLYTTLLIHKKTVQNGGGHRS
jgi:hypothetical protein